MRTVFFLFIFCIGTCAVFGEETFRLHNDMAYDAEQQCYFATTICDEPFNNKGQGTVAKLSLDFIEESKAPFCRNLNAPTGLCLTKAFIVVCDQNTIKFFSRKTGTHQKTLTFAKPREVLFSDVVFDGDRYVYTCDMFGHSILRIDITQHFKTTVVDYGPWLKFPCRLLYYTPRQTLFVGSYSSGEVYEIHPRSHERKTLILFGPHKLNGLAIDEAENIYVSTDQDGGSVVRISPRKEFVKLDRISVAPNNIVIPEGQQMLLIPSATSDMIQNLDLKQ